MKYLRHNLENTPCYLQYALIYSVFITMGLWYVHFVFPATAFEVMSRSSFKVFINTVEPLLIVSEETTGKNNKCGKAIDVSEI